MGSLPIRNYGDPVLRAKGEPVREFGPALRALGDTMLETMRAAKGIGLAAPQVGLSLQLFVLDVCDPEARPILDGKERDPAEVMPMLLANAEVAVAAGEPVAYDEGCLSFPGVRGSVTRIERASVRFRDADGAPHVLECSGLLARCVQHEHDHCQGVLFIDRMSGPDLLLATARIKRIRRDTEATLRPRRRA
ncbi:MAG: peptide deformylase [Opitutales bacterium]